VNPATGQLVEDVGVATDGQVDRAVDDAHTAWPRWRTTPVEERAEVLRRAAAEFDRRRDELARIITLEMGKRIEEARRELGLVSDIFTYYADHGPTLLADETIPVARGHAAVQKQSIGPVLGIMPWNFPNYQIARFAAPNLVLGNPVLYKPAPNCPHSGAAVAEVLASAGVPHGVFATLYASNDQVAAIIADPRVQGVSLTGSERAGAAVGSLASQHLKRVVLELGGSDPLLVLDVTEPATVGALAASARMNNMGQACNSPKRMIVLDAHYEAFAAALMQRLGDFEPGDPLDPATSLAPLSSQAAADRIVEQVERATRQGAELVTGGTQYDRPGSYVEPAVLTGVDSSMDAYHEELFGPAVVLHRVADEAAAVALANDTPFGLGACLFSEDDAQVDRVAAQLECGMVYVNQPERSQADLPFGGVKRSGVGRELGALGLEAFMNHKLVRR
jgi:succinate-semialdehyde dehydrogenase/glutarate-semialdehyde dehydrogenase